MQIPNFLGNVLATLVVTLALPFSQSHGAVIVAGNPTDGSGTFTITEDISFTITVVDAVPYAIVFDEWVTNEDGNRTQLSLSPGSINFSIVGIYDDAFAVPTLSDNFSIAYGAVTANDGLIVASSSAGVRSPGDVIIVRAGTWSIPASPNFNLETVGTFEGDVFLAGDAGSEFLIRLSSNGTPVPEPSGLTLSLLGSLVLIARRRR